MHPLLAFTGYVALSLGLGGLVAYPLNLLFGPVFDLPFHRVASRSIMLMALFGLPLLLRLLQVRGRTAFGFGLSPRAFAGGVAGGFAAGVVMLAPLVLVLLALDVRIPDPESPRAAGALALLLGGVLLSSFAIGILEEAFFRGVLFGAMGRRSGVALALLTTSILYAAVHFLSFRYKIPEAEQTWQSGLVVVSHAFSKLAEPLQIVDSFLALFAAGALLCLVRLRVGHIAHCVGLHAGWVFVIKVTKTFTNTDLDSGMAFLVGSYDEVTGYLAFFWIGLLTLIFARLFPARERLAPDT